MNFKDKLFLLSVLGILVVLGAWLGYASVTGKPITYGAAKATALALFATPTTTESPMATQTATPEATSTPPALAETATAVARTAWSYKDRVEELERKIETTATREAKWQEEAKASRREADGELRNAGCYEHPCVVVSWESGYDRWDSVMADGKSVAGGNWIFQTKVLVEWDNYDRWDSVVVKPSTRKTRQGEPYAVWVYVTYDGELRLTELPVGELYGN